MAHQNAFAAAFSGLAQGLQLGLRDRRQNLAQGRQEEFQREQFEFQKTSKERGFELQERGLDIREKFGAEKTLAEKILDKQFGKQLTRDKKRQDILKQGRQEKDRAQKTLFIIDKELAGVEETISLTKGTGAAGELLLPAELQKREVLLRRREQVEQRLKEIEESKVSLSRLGLKKGAIQSVETPTDAEAFQQQLSPEKRQFFQAIENASSRDEVIKIGNEFGAQFAGDSAALRALAKKAKASLDRIKASEIVGRQ